MEHVHIIGEGKLFLNYGPMQMTIQAEREGRGDVRLAEKGAARALVVFNALCRQLPAARMRVSDIPEGALGVEILDLMISAARRTGVAEATPMLAVAGGIAELTAKALQEMGAERAIVNNGGDIALALDKGQAAAVGVMTDITAARPEYMKRIDFSTPIRGVAASGLGGRSFTQGIASAVVAFAESAAQADACATILGNATYVKDKRIRRAPAKTLRADTDIPELPVTVSVEPLPGEIVAKALNQAKRLALQYIKSGVIHGALITVQGQTTMVPDGVAYPILVGQR